MVVLYPTVIQPLFNKLSPLANGDLRTRIEALASKLKFPLKHLYEIDGSKRSSHSNAYFFGLPWVRTRFSTFFFVCSTWRRVNTSSFSIRWSSKASRKKLKLSLASSFFVVDANPYLMCQFQPMNWDTGITCTQPSSCASPSFTYSPFLPSSPRSCMRRFSCVHLIFQKQFLHSHLPSSLSFSSKWFWCPWKL